MALWYVTITARILVRCREREAAKARVYIQAPEDLPVHRHFPFKRQIFKTAHGPKEQLSEFPPFLRGVRGSHTVVCVFMFPGPNRFFPPSFQCRRRSHHPQPLEEHPHLLPHPHLFPRGARPPPEGNMPLKTHFAPVLKGPGEFFSSNVACTTLQNCRLYQAFF